MFESAELGHRLAKAAFRALEPGLRADLLAAQTALRDAGKFPVVILISGVRGAGKGETVNLLNEWMDPRFIQTLAFDDPTDEERARPPMWRYWRALPPKGRIGILFGSWYTQPIIDRVFARIDRHHLDHAVAEINHFERMLADEGALIIKFWFHLGRKQQRKRLKALEADPETAWRVAKRDWDFFALYDRFYRISEDTLRQTSTGWAPWIVVESANPEYRAATVGQTVLAALRQRLGRPDDAAPRPAEAAPILAPVDKLRLIDRLDLSQSIARTRARAELGRSQRDLAVLTRHKRFAEHAVVCVFEGMDAAGKGGAIRRVTRAIDARLYAIVPVAAPSDEERAQPYLWRFWRHVPRAGRFTLFDRSWYGRVLVERVEGFCIESDWLRAYAEINQFEEQLVRSGIVVVKFWLQISPDEQLRRFEERAATPFKQFKITPEDWRNREKWDLYQSAASDMIERTGTRLAPWTLVEANDKAFGRLKVVRTLVESLRHALG